MNARLLFVHALSPLHAGTGQGVGVIDLPIAREKATGLPFLPGSSVKGSLRDSCPEKIQLDGEEISCIQVFGPKKDKAEEWASSVQFSDQRLLLLPVRSLRGTFAWVTSPYVLHRLVRDAKDTNTISLALDVPPPTSSATTQECLVTNTSQLALNDKVYLEDLDLTVGTDAAKKAQTVAWACALAEKIFPAEATWRDYLKERFCIVPDDVLNFLLDTATEINARIALEENSKTAAEGQLWYEEALPCETVLCGLVFATEIAKANIKPDQALKVVDGLTKETANGSTRPKPVQLGGKATVGRGFCHLMISA